MNYITIEVDNQTNMQLLTQLLKQVKGVQKIIRHDSDTEWNISDEMIKKEHLTIFEHQMMDEWLSTEEDEIWNDYLKKQIDEKI